MARFANVGLLVAGNLLLAAGAFCSFGAYSSGDASGLQYILLDFSFWFAVSAMPVLALAAWRQGFAVLWLNVLLAPMALLVARLPQVTGLGYNGSVLDRPGSILSLGLLILAMIVCVVRIIRVRGGATCRRIA